MKDAWWGHGDGTVGVFGGHTTFADPRRQWDFRSVGRGDVDFEEIIERGYDKYTVDGVDWLNWWDNNTKFKHGTAIILCGNNSRKWDNTHKAMQLKGYPYLNERYLT